MRTAITLALLMVAILGAEAINLYLLPGDHLVSSLYLLPVLVACHRLRPGAVAGVAAVAVGLYFVDAMREQRPLVVWPFGVLSLIIGGYLTIQFATHRQEIVRREREAKDAREHLQVFMGMVAHELAGGLTNVQLGAELLVHGGRELLDEGDRIANAAIVGGTRQMQRLLDDLRAAASLGAGHFDVRASPMDLVPVARQISEQQQATTDRHRLVLDAAPALDGAWDRERIGQLLTNLISNAIKYSPDGGEVKIVVRPSAGGALVSVRDQGIGIAADQLADLFRPFSRLDQPVDAPGSGLGLWIAKAIVEAHHGRISVASEEGKGSTFSVWLPSVAVEEGWSRARAVASDRPLRVESGTIGRRPRLAARESAA